METIMKKTMMTTVAALAVFGFAGVANANQQQPQQDPNVDVTNSFNDKTIVKTVDSFNDKTTYENTLKVTDSFNLKSEIDTRIDISLKDSPITTAVATDHGSALIVGGNNVATTAEAKQDSSYPSLKSIDNTLSTGAAAADTKDCKPMGWQAQSSGSAGTMDIGAVNLSQASIGSGVGSNIGGVVLSSVNTASAVSFGGDYTSTIGNTNTNAHP